MTTIPRSWARPWQTLLALIVAFLPFSACLDAQYASVGGQLQLGDSLRDYLGKNLIKYYLKMEGQPTWYEAGMIDFATYTKDFDGELPAFLVWNKKIPIGVLQGKPPKAFFLFDTDGDGILDYKSEEFVLPIYVVISNSPVTDSNHNQIKRLLDVFYDAFQSDAGPYESEAMRTSLRSAFIPYKMDPTQPNRDLFYLLSYYIQYTHIPAEALIAIRELHRRYNERYEKDHPIILLYLLESSINARRDEDARRYCDELLKLRPDFIPARFYQSELEVDRLKAVKIKQQLKSKHPNHWLVKKLDSD